MKEDVAALRQKADVVVASFHWGLNEDVLQYMHEIAHAAVDAGADLVMGHGPHHYSLPIEVYRGKPIFYGLGAFSFQTGHHGVNHGHWVGLLARVDVCGNAIEGVTVQFLRQNLAMQVRACSLRDEQAAFEDLSKRSAVYGTVLTARGDEIALELEC
jgi:poly-gamma-glutamate synthesis protein (capsule biosynthesis protein)